MLTLRQRKDKLCIISDGVIIPPIHRNIFHGDIKMNDIVRNIEKLVFDSFKEISNHTLQTEVLSPQIKSINHNLENILKQLEKLQGIRKKLKPHSGTRDFVGSPQKKILVKLAYAMSRFDYHIINDILREHFNQTEAFQYLAKKFTVKTATLRNYRDCFDPYVKQENSNRIGWTQKILPPQFQAIKEDYDSRNYASLKNEIENILNNPANS